MKNRYQIVTFHGEHSSLFFVCDLGVRDEEGQPCVIKTFSTRKGESLEEAQKYVERLDGIERYWDQIIQGVVKGIKKLWKG